jgi:hypothetical protein
MGHHYRQTSLWELVQNYCSIVHLIAISFQNIANSQTKPYCSIFSNYCHYSYHIFLKEPPQTYRQNNQIIFLQPFLSKKLNQTNCQNNSLLLTGSSFFPFCSPLSAKQIGGITIISWNPTLPTTIGYLLYKPSLGVFI